MGEGQQSLEGSSLVHICRRHACDVPATRSPLLPAILSGICERLTQIYRRHWRLSRSLSPTDRESWVEFNSPGLSAMLTGSVRRSGVIFFNVNARRRLTQTPLRHLKAAHRINRMEMAHKTGAFSLTARLRLVCDTPGACLWYYLGHS